MTVIIKFGECVSGVRWELFKANRISFFTRHFFLCGFNHCIYIYFNDYLWF
jgi:hypothetical protein